MSNERYIIAILLCFIIYCVIRGQFIIRRERLERLARDRREANQALFFLVSTIGIQGLTMFLDHRKKKKQEKELERDDN
jgi:hypothetical protein